MSPTYFFLPDLHVENPFVGSFNPNYSYVSFESSACIDSRNVQPDTKRAFFRSSGELLCAHAYPHADHERFRTTGDLINLLFTLDEISDNQNEADGASTERTFYNALSDLDYNDGTTLCKSVLIHVWAEICHPSLTLWFPSTAQSTTRCWNDAVL
ncbi:hypothetical protein BD414DRAFT_580250 [Trametes punicea]|nr:hypothetical protein BD414DRAFT_580250 [Trametes punicea]